MKGKETIDREKAIHVRTIGKENEAVKIACMPGSLYKRKRKIYAVVRTVFVYSEILIRKKMN